MTDLSLDRAVWAALQDQRPVTLDELQMLTGCDAGEITVYLNVLARHRYVSVLGIKRAASGEAIPLFQLTNPTGPQAPYGDDTVFVDPNLAKPGIRRRCLRRHQPIGELPTMQGRIRSIAARLGNPFTRREILESIPEAVRDQFPRGWARLVWRGDLVLIQEHNDTGGIWQMVFHRELIPIRDWCREHLGSVIDAQAIRAAGMDVPRGPIVRMACDMLAAEGYTVTEQQGRKTKSYRVDAKEQA